MSEYNLKEIRAAVHSYINPEFSGHNCEAQAEKIYLGLKDELEGAREHSPAADVYTDEDTQRARESVEVKRLSLKDITDKVVEMAMAEILSSLDEIVEERKAILENLYHKYREDDDTQTATEPACVCDDDDVKMVAYWNCPVHGICKAVEEY